MLKQMLTLTLALGAAAPGSAWGVAGHRIVASGVVADLPPEVAVWFKGFETALPDHVNDPDHWKYNDPEEGPRHYLDCEYYGGPDRIPHDPEEARTRVGPDVFQKAGQVPWTVLDRVARVTRAFQDGDRPQLALEAAWLCHYVGDLQVPLHTTTNHNGDETNQHGIHRRWETDLVERAAAQGWKLEVRPAAFGVEPREAPWSWLQESYNLVPGLLTDDLTAKGAQPPPDARLAIGEPDLGTRYWKLFFQLQAPHVKEQLNLAAQRSARMIVLAWYEAGSPAPPKR